MYMRRLKKKGWKKEEMKKKWWNDEKKKKIEKMNKRLRGMMWHVVSLV